MDWVCLFVVYLLKLLWLACFAIGLLRSFVVYPGVVVWLFTLVFCDLGCLVYKFWVLECLF